MEAEPEDVINLLKRGEEYLKKHGVPNSRNNVEWMLCHLLNCNRGGLYTGLKERITRKTVIKFNDFLTRRGKREPLQYILRSTEFMSLPFAVPPGVFIPRFETEILVETAEKIICETSANGRFLVLDLCSGSGAIAISLAKRLPCVFAIGVDASDLAVKTAGANAELNNVQDKVNFFTGDAFDFLSSSKERFGAVLCNPPYIREGEIPKLAPEVREYEPLSGLDGGEDGLDFFRSIIPIVPGRLGEDGFLVMEIGSDQGSSVKEMCIKSSMVDVEVIKDYNQFDRILIARAA